MKDSTERNKELRQEKKGYTDVYVVRGRGVGHLDIHKAVESEAFRKATRETIKKIDARHPASSLVTVED